MKLKKRAGVLLAALGITALCSGCFVQSADELYALPRQSDAYYKLQEALDSVVPKDAVALGPDFGPNQQAVQMINLDNDPQDEVLAFVKAAGEKPLKVYIFDRTGDTYENTAVIEGDGAAFDSVEYVQLDGKPGMEILVGKRLGGEILKSLSGYAYEDGNLVELMAANYAEYTVADLDTDGFQDVFLLRMGTEESRGVAELYRYHQGGLMEREQEANLSPEARDVKRIVTGQVSPGIPAVFVASAYEEDTIVTDIFAYRNQVFQNISSGLSVKTVRNYNVYATDIDGDGVIEMPNPVALPSNVAGEDTYWTIDWYNLSPDGVTQTKMTTFHNYPGGWYLELPGSWRGRLSVERSKEVEGVRGYCFRKWNGRGRETEEIFTLYAFTGENRETLAVADGRFLLAEKGETAYAAVLGESDWAKALNQEEMKEMFRFIHVDWNSGER